jgi:hypothetical protein
VTLDALSTFCHAIGAFYVLIFADSLRFREASHAKKVLDATGGVFGDAVYN